MAPKVGAPTFKGMVDLMRAQNPKDILYFIQECIDNILNKCKRINIDFEINEKNIIELVTISDDYEKGFENIDKDGEKNPFNLTHVQDDQKNDHVMNNFGIGFKSGAISVSDYLKVWTRVNDEYWNVEYEINRMKRKNRFQPFKYTTIHKEDYDDVHRYTHGSTIRIQNLLREFKLSDIDFDDLFHPYGFQTPETKITYTINDGEETEFKPILANLIFDIINPPLHVKHTIKVYTKNNNITDIIIFDPFKREYKFTSKMKSIQIVEQFDESTLNDYDSSYEMVLHTIIVPQKKYSNDELKIKEYGSNNIAIIRNGRAYGCNKYYISDRNGELNYIFNKLEYVSKKLNIFLGVKPNKEIDFQTRNPLTECLTKITKYTSYILKKRLKHDKIKLPPKMIQMKSVANQSGKKTLDKSSSQHISAKRTQDIVSVSNIEMTKSTHKSPYIYISDDDDDGDDGDGDGDEPSPKKITRAYPKRFATDKKYKPVIKQQKPKPKSPRTQIEMWNDTKKMLFSEEGYNNNGFNIHILSDYIRYELSNCTTRVHKHTTDIVLGLQNIITDLYNYEEAINSQPNTN
jgi:hypothetical protein